MKRITNQLFVVAVLLAGMYLLNWLKADSAGEGGGDPLTLAAIGFVVLTAFTLAELGSLLKLPKVTGYILAGIALGPFAGNILSAHVVGEMRMFNDLTLGLIATSAGLELDAKAIRKMGRTLGVTTLIKVVLTPILVGSTFFVLQQLYGFLPLSTTAEVIGLAITFAALAIGTSPSITLALLRETGAKGPLSELTLGSAVFKDVVVVVALAIAVATAVAINTPGGSLDAGLLLQVGLHLAQEVFVGIALALFLILYMRFIGAEMLLFVAAMILVVTWVAAALQLEPLLVFITAGFVVRNFTNYEHTLMHPLEVVSLPVFVVFFTIAGASVNLQDTLAILPFALALCFARGVSYWIAGRYGAAAGSMSPVVQRVAWLAYLPQAGVTLGLVGIAASQLPDFEVIVRNTGMAVVAINLLIGPVALRYAWRTAGELPDRTGRTNDASAPERGAALPLVLRPTLDEPDLQAVIDRVDTAGTDALRKLVDEQVKPWARSLRKLVHDAVPPGESVLSDASLAKLLDLIANVPTLLPARDRAQALRDTFDAVRTAMSELPLELEAPLRPRHFRIKGGEAFGLRVRRKSGWLGWKLGLHGARRVPVRMGARTAVEPRLAEGIRDGLTVWCRTEGAVLAELRNLVEGNRDAAELRSGIPSLLETWTTKLYADLDHSLTVGLVELARTLDQAGSAELPIRHIRFSRVEPVISRTLQDLERTGRRWEPALDAATDTVAARIRVELVHRKARTLVSTGFVEPLIELLDAIVPEVIAVRQRLEEAKAGLGSIDPSDKEQLGTLLASCRKAFPQDAHVRIKKLRSEFKERAAEQPMSTGLRELVHELPESARVLAGATPLHFAKGLDEVHIVDSELRDLGEDGLVHDLLPAVSDRMRETNALVTVLNSQLREHVSVAVFAIDMAIRGQTAEHDVRLLVSDGIERSLRRVDELATSLERLREETPAQMYEALADAIAVIRTGVAHGRSDKTPRRTRAVVVRRSFAAVFGRLGLLLAHARDRVSALIRQLRASDLSQEMQRRSGRSRLDAAGLRELLYAEIRRPEQEPLPPIYARLFALEPVLDRRLFAARRSELKILVREEQLSAEGVGSEGVLIVGERGSGRTSLLNVAQLDFRSARVVRVAQEQGRLGGFVGALAAELQCEPRPGDVRRELANERTAIVIDDLERWITPDPSGLAELERILDLVLATRGVAFWVATINEDALQLVDPLVSIRQAFGRVLTLSPLDAEGLAMMIESRNRVSGLQIRYPQRRWAKFRDRQGDPGRTAYFRNLVRTSRGNLRGALRAWYRDVRPGPGDTILPSLRSNVLAGHRFLNQLHPHAVAVLVQATRFGTLEIERLTATLGLSHGEVARHVAFLQAAGLLVTRPGFADSLRLAPEVQPTLTTALAEAGALRRVS